MTDADLATFIDQYRVGLDAEITILRRLEQAALRQLHASDARDFVALNFAADDRDSLMRALVTIEGQLHDVRQVLSGSRDVAATLPGYTEAVALQREAIRLVSEILRTDEQSAESLATAEMARRDLAPAMEQGVTTLAAYRRAMTTPPGATLVDRRG